MLELGDIERAIAINDPQLGEHLVAYLDQDDPSPGRSELEPDDDADDDTALDPPDNAFDLAALRRAMTDKSGNRTNTEVKLARQEAFATAEISPYTPPRLRLGKILIRLYERGDDLARTALVHVFAFGRMRWGVWQAAKTIYKRAEAAHDLAMFGVLAYRFDAMAQTPHDATEIRGGTLTYLRRRAWRALKQIGTALPDVYPTYAVEVLKHFPNFPSHATSWVAAHIWGHKNLHGARGITGFAPPTWGDPMTMRAFPDAWKLSPSPLLRLLDVAANDQVCDFAIRCLRADHPLALRAVEPAWLARLGARKIAAIDGFAIALLKDNPDFHQSKLRGLGLHGTVIGFLRSNSADARGYAIEYAQNHGQDLSVDALVELVTSDHAEVVRFAAARLEQLPPPQIGLVNLVRLLAFAATPWATDKLGQGFDPRAIDPALFVQLAAAPAGDGLGFKRLLGVYVRANVTVPAGHWIALLDDPRFLANDWSVRDTIQLALTELGKRTAKEIGVPWIQRSLEQKARTAAVATWLDAGMLSGADLDLDWLKRLVGKQRLRPIALRLLGDRRRVEPAAVGLPWLLELARSPEADLAQFAQRMLLESFEPADFAMPAPDSRAIREADGVGKLWALATGPKQKEAVRTFAATYLKAHHPDLGPRTPEARTLGIKPRLAHTAYALATVRPLFEDDRGDVRRLAVAIGAEEITRWDDRELVYQLASGKFPEPRRLGAELLLSVLATEPAPRIPAAWIDGPHVFQLAESGHKASREIALTLIRRMYDRVGGAERLAWLMESPERDVRLFAVRLFWDRHRPKPWPADYVPRKAVGAPLGTERFSDLAALRQFARVVLFGLPPGRIGERDPVLEGGPKPERALPASIAKRRLIEAMRDVGLEDLELARAIAPVLTEFTHSTAKGEWHASVQALTQLRAKHGAEMVA